MVALENKKEINYSMNVIKCLAIIGVIIIHCGLWKLGRKGMVIQGIARFAVPFFFLVSGYFSYYISTTKAMDKYKTRIYRLIKLFIAASVLYIILRFFILHMNDISDYNLIDMLINLILFNNDFYAGHLWFIAALIYCYVIYYFVNRFEVDYKILYWLIPILLTIGLFLSEFVPKMGINIPVFYYRNFLFMGLPFFSLGHLIHNYRDVILSKISSMSLVILSVGCCLLTMFEALNAGKADLLLGPSILAVCIFIWCVKNPDSLKRFKISGFIGGKLYVYIYILHVALVFYLRVKGIELGFLKPIIVFVVTTLVSYAIYLIKEKVRPNDSKIIG